MLFKVRGAILHLELPMLRDNVNSNLLLQLSIIGYYIGDNWIRMTAGIQAFRVKTIRTCLAMDL